ncbi:ribonuclease H [Alkalihalobacillus alcalophilus ATCC 27647 = CGMCC 1.3604]|uniref:Ribonuclease H n=1 Tax=Alkalihalobacillus alcalophilus ATCC 27647 = CGMCC 1.3604 TaxID=1218173 RepID=A0A094XDC4_ALKAL|nr:ribonuclease H family protein [Alkalihalobacillus alcalophilus]KGA96755.1 ribonuclease H [Alkalihalobacillus alcalophilus ATCC 27647 = CGMCC 1.3604]MED1561784.1 ribonuclease H family protein [Alkalihalobacillus alcalophilus]THG91798.1 ribonuclease H [Alkalihalobacillus alcalophilus ATCC 27647 = CGMCC 1.3604]
MAKGKFYVVWEGREKGIFTTWAECEKQVKGYQGARFKSFPTEKEAKAAFANRPSSGAKKSGPKKSAKVKVDPSEIIWDSISVDVGSKGNPGIIEYKGVDTKTGEILFAHDEIPVGTNNMGEFLAIVHGLAYLKEQGSTKPIYSDSVTGMKWVKQKKANATLVRNKETAYIWELVERAEQWLHENRYENQIIKWQTESWGEIKADYGRK